MGVDQGVVMLTATASDAQGITSVDFLVDGVQVGSDSSSPYSISWDSGSVADGQHTMTARATDGSSMQRCVGASVTTGHPEIQGDWVGTTARPATCWGPGTAPPT